jgi:hypothetical protein
MNAPWQAKEGCPAHLRPALESWVNNHDPEWLLAPSKGEVFDSFKRCFQRIQLFAVSQGFAVVIRGQGSEETPSRRYQCIHHDEETQDWRGLLKKVKKDSEGKIISSRKREVINTK